MLAQFNQGGANFPGLAIPRFAEQLNGKAQWQVIAVCQPARQGQGVEKASLPFRDDALSENHDPLRHLAKAIPIQR